jgi:raffinose/stachyose/melibiose transport system permease protein
VTSIVPTQAFRPGHAAGAESPPRRRPKLSRSSFVPYVYLLPGFVMILVFVLIPSVQTIQLSFYNWDGLGVATWAGLNNYAAVFLEAENRAAFVNAFSLIAFYAVAPIALGFLLVSLLSRGGAKPMKGMTAYRTVLFIPQAITLVVAAIAWQWLFSPTGPLATLARGLGFQNVPGFLGDYTWALPSIGIIGVWLMAGLCLVLFMAGVQRIDPSLYEAARMDGANNWQLFWAVTFPGLRGELQVALILTVGAALRSFDLVYVLTQGGPGKSTTVPSLEIYIDAFRRGEVGTASALGVVLLIVVGLVTSLIFALTRKAD